MIEINEETDILFLKNKGSVNTYAMAVYHEIIRDVVDAYIYNWILTHPFPQKRRMVYATDNFLCSNTLDRLRGKIPNIRFIGKELHSENLCIITDESEILDKMWNRVKARSQWFFKNQEKDFSKIRKMEKMIDTQIELELTAGASTKSQKQSQMKKITTPPKGHKQTTSHLLSTGKGRKRKTTCENGKDTTSENELCESTDESLQGRNGDECSKVLPQRKRDNGRKNPMNKMNPKDPRKQRKQKKNQIKKKNPKNQQQPHVDIEFSDDSETDECEQTSNQQKSHTPHPKSHKTDQMRNGITTNGNHTARKNKKTPTKHLTTCNTEESHINCSTNMSYSEMITKFDLKVASIPGDGNCGYQALLHHYNIEHNTTIDIYDLENVCLFRRYLSYMIMKSLLETDDLDFNAYSDKLVFTASIHEEDIFNNALYSIENHEKYKIGTDEDGNIDASLWMDHEVILPLIAFALKKSICSYVFNNGTETYNSFILYDVTKKNQLCEIINSNNGNEPKLLQMRPFPETMFMYYEFNKHYNLHVGRDRKYHKPMYRRNTRSKKKTNPFTNIKHTNLFIKVEDYNDMKKRFDELFC